MGTERVEMLEIGRVGNGIGLQEALSLGDQRKVDGLSRRLVVCLCNVSSARQE